ncbi:MAG: HAMP domain-containing sensor histidine kinase [Proteobacteria bacterium]|nr:HAMP domain-containing sensor histidine kinase [Pseudomonadota bacterium]
MSMRVITHPIFIFVGFQCVWVSLTLLWVFWFAREVDGINVILDNSGNITEIIMTSPSQESQERTSHLKKLNVLRLFSQVIGPSQVLSYLIAGFIMLGTLLFGAIWLFWFGQRKASYFRQQQAFISSVTHELRTPITTLGLVLGNLKNDNLAKNKFHHLLEIGEGELKRLMNLINNILLTAKLDRGIDMLDEKKQKVTLNTLLNVAVERNKILDKDINSRVIITCLPALSINAPKSALITVFSNLIQNAVKYSPKGSMIKIDVSFYGGDYVDITFQDEGYGIEEGDLKKIFKMFYRGSVSEQQGVTGTGVGLFIVKTIVKILKGHIWASSEGRMKGSQFTMRLPID